MIRFILDAAWVIIFLILSIPFVLIELIVGLFSKKVKARTSQWIIKWAFSVVLFISGTKVKVLGKENIPADEPVLFVPNHRSIFDIVIPYTIFPNQTGFIAKKETKKFPVFNLWMMFMNCQFLDRSDLRDGLRVINKSADLIKDGVSMCVFPEGTRNKGEEVLGPFHDGCLKIAQKAGCPVIPVTIVGSDDIFENHFPKVIKQAVTVEFGKPIETKEMSKAEFKELSGMIREVIIENYNKNKNDK
ncbi:MAG: 1-acyl-sn-glycerol-3-phosphate acyltransferase [Lachnospiraceae bacterium]|nr:1-acyl-sn-glycerol-3-phosphate acyltransferase [Lachnospiraceae bacterium]